jgi:hypothetical protein
MNKIESKRKSRIRIFDCKKHSGYSRSHPNLAPTHLPNLNLYPDPTLLALPNWAR